MLTKKKLLTAALSSVVVLSMAIAGGTYALFTASAQNTANHFTAGTLNVESTRDDIPNMGPMFYTDSVAGQVGAMPTGIWAPGDKNTRGLFLENKGSLEARMVNVFAKATNSGGQPVSAASMGTDLQAYHDAVLFANQAKVIVWQVQRIDPDLGFSHFGKVSATEYDNVMDSLNSIYKMWYDAHPGANIDDQTWRAELISFANQELLNKLNQQNSGGSKPYFQVVKLYDESLNNLLASPVNTKSYDIKVKHEEAAMLGFTVHFLKHPPHDIDPNSMQGKKVYFTFGTNWEQVKNN